MKKLIKDNRGFTMIETMIALSFFTIALLGTASLYIRASQNNAQGNVISAANFLAKTTLEQRKNLPLSSLPVGTTSENGIDENGEAGGIYSRTVEIASINGGEGRQITVTVTWPRNKRDSDMITITSNLKGEGI